MTAKCSPRPGFAWSGLRPLHSRLSPPTSCADHIMAAQGSGEFALRHILEPLAHGREPLEDALQGIQARTIWYTWHDDAALR